MVTLSAFCFLQQNNSFKQLKWKNESTTSVSSPSQFDPPGRSHDHPEPVTVQLTAESVKQSDSHTDIYFGPMSHFQPSQKEDCPEELHLWGLLRTHLVKVVAGPAELHPATGNDTLKPSVWEEWGQCGLKDGEELSSGGGGLQSGGNRRVHRGITLCSDRCTCLFLGGLAQILFSSVMLGQTL